MIPRESIYFKVARNGKLYQAYATPRPESGTNEKFATVYQIVIDDYYYDSLHYRNGSWQLGKDKPQELADYIGNYIELWYC